jgi:hypothetical protein
LGLNVAGYLLGGLEGLGISFFIGYLIYLLQVFILAKRKYTFTFGKAFYKIFGIQFSLGILCFLSSRLLPSPFLYIGGILLISLASYYSFQQLNKRLNLIPLILEKLGKNNSPK